MSPLNAENPGQLLHPGCPGPSGAAQRVVRILIRSLLVAFVAGFVFRGAPAQAADKAELHVFAAASLSAAFTEVARTYERQHPGVSVKLHLAGSQQLVAQLDEGARGDVFASADDRWMGRARERGLLAGEPVAFARNRLVVIVPKINPGRIHRIQDLARSGLKVVIGADPVPVGHYARVMLANLSRDPAFGAGFAARVLANVVSEEDNVKSIVGKIQLGEADAGVVYRSDVTPALVRYVRSFEIPEGMNVIATYPIAALTQSPRAGDASAFVALVLSAAGPRILARSGFVPVGPIGS